MTKEVLKLALEALENNRQTHHYCEDTWYSCPKHEDGCANDSEGDECNCGADKANAEIDKAITAIKEALAQPEHEPVAMRMPKVGDEVICIEDDSLGTVAYLTAGGSPEIRFDDGSHGTYMLREFAELFRYTSPPPQRKPLTAMEVYDVVHDADLDWHTGFALGEDENRFVVFARAIEAAHGIGE